MLESHIEQEMLKYIFNNKELLQMWLWLVVVKHDLNNLKFFLKRKSK